MLLLYTHQITSRIRYTFNLIFKTVLEIEFEITTDAEKFKTYDEAKISYTKKPIADELFFQSEDLLFENGIRNIFQLPSDNFALAFFLTTRYEEYLPFEADKYGRFSAKKSFSYNLLHKPTVNLSAKEIQKKISERYSDFNFPEKKYSYQPSIDIDNAYAYKGKSFTRTLGGYARAISKSDKEDFAKRKNVLSGKEKDPYDTYDFQFSLHKKYHLKPVYFFLLGDWAENDKNLPHTNPLMQALIKNISQSYALGIHPSFASNKNPEKISIEKERLKKISGKEIIKSRQHFLILKFPQTYQNLIASGITDDFTMGFADEIGFRAGICTPYKWYDLEKEEETNLIIHPFAVMDGTLNNYLKLSPEQALEKVKAIIQEIKNVNGEFISIWHNETLSDWREWKGWKDVYEKIIQLAQ
ncbi:MAG: polysaccharide deacetylase family protein [Bacteroidetes bacterium]|nr:polysaccharide deacetylase family protein [Bacteroidota bacterium]